jgi:hypothetical protein
MFYRKYKNRPEFFEICEGPHWAKRGLVFAGLGRVHGSTHYRDSSGRGNHGTLVNCEPSDWLFDPTLGRWCIDYDGSEEYSSIPAGLLSGRTTFTISMWVYQYSTGGSTYGAWYSSNTAYNAGVFLGRSDTARIQYWIATDYRLSGNSELLVNQWSHIALTYKSGAFNRLYRNGSLLVDGEVITQTVPSHTESQLSSCATSSLYTKCKQSDVLIYPDRALSPSEIQQLADPSNVCLSGLIVPPRRVLWPVAAAISPSGWFPIHTRRGRIIHSS